MKKYSYEKIKDISNKINYTLLESKTTFDSKYKNTLSKIKVQCNNCKKISEIQINNLINKFRYCKNPCKCYEKHTRESFLKKAKEIHGDKYDYSLITEEWWQKNYKNINKTIIPIKCPKHGVFKQRISDHIIVKNGCVWCTSKLHYVDFLKKAKEIHGDKYDYSLITEEWWRENFTSQEKTKIPIICPKHGVFYQLVVNHIRYKTGCSKCKESDGERLIRRWFEENNINYEYQKQIKIKNREKPMYLDFYVPEKNLAIEFDGWFHYHDHFGTKLEITQERDKIKNQYCKENNIELLRIPYWEAQNIEKILNKTLKEDKCL